MFNASHNRQLVFTSNTDNDRMAVAKQIEDLEKSLKQTTEFKNQF